MAGKEIKLSIVIVNFKSLQFLEACLNSIRKKISSQIETEVIIVNNDKEENLENFQNVFSEVNVTNSKENIGFSQACNVGAGIAKGEFILFLNPDTEIKSENISEIIKYFEEDAFIAVIGARLINENGETQHWITGQNPNLFDLLGNNFGWPRSRRIWEKKNNTVVSWVSGAALIVRKNVFDSLGGFDQNFFMYYEDIDLCQRAKKENFKIIYFPSFKILHHGGKSYSDKFSQKKDFYTSQQYYFEKHCGRLQSALVKHLRRIFG